jgi:hypothetical protein
MLIRLHQLNLTTTTTTTIGFQVITPHVRQAVRLHLSSAPLG